MSEKLCALRKIGGGMKTPKVIGIVRGSNLCLWVEGEVPDNNTNGAVSGNYSMSRNTGNGNISVTVPVTSELEIHTSVGTVEDSTVTTMTLQANVSTVIGYADQSRRRWFYIY
jgi:hypothetical protein